MSIQDDFIDVDSALEGKPEAEAFGRIWKALCRLEEFQENVTPLLVAIERGAKARQLLETGKWRK